jgi:hypothetical protein
LGSGDFGLPGAGNSRITAGVTADNTTREAGAWNGWWWVNAAGDGSGSSPNAGAATTSINRETFRTYPVFFMEVDIARNQDLFNALSTSAVSSLSLYLFVLRAVTGCFPPFSLKPCVDSTDLCVVCVGW